MAVQVPCATCGKMLVRRPHRAKGSCYCSVGCKNNPGPIVLSKDGKSALIALRARDGSVRAHAVVDAADAAFVNQWRWSLGSHGYARRGVTAKGLRQDILLHRELLGLPRTSDGREGDHVDLDRLNNRRLNLRIIPKAGQQQNVPSHGLTSSHRGVSWSRKVKKWRAELMVNRKQFRLGYFDSEIEAAEAVRTARVRLMPFAVN